MNRKIKFRIWDKINKKWLNCFNANLLNIGDLSNVELMQYTGIKDKNGVEIYEGDIVLIRIDKTNILHKTIVKFKHGAFIADIIGNNDYIYLFHFGFNKDDFEVVGNIYGIMARKFINEKGFTVYEMTGAETMEFGG